MVTETMIELKVATWKIRCITGKEKDRETRIRYIVITETMRKKGGGARNRINRGRACANIQCDKKKTKRATAGVGCIIHNKHVDKIKDWELTSERNLKGANGKMKMQLHSLLNMVKTRMT